MIRKLPSVSVILLSAGRGLRAGFGIPKQFVKLKGVPVYRYSLDFFLKFDFVKEVLLVIQKNFRPLVKSGKKIKIVSGGRRRQDSVRHALRRVNENSEIVAVHDSARPFVDEGVFLRCVRAAKKWGAAVPAIPVENTIKESEKGFVRRTPNREKLFAVSTPQVFRREFSTKMYKLLSGKKVYTDDVSILEEMGVPVKIVRMKEMNMKITRKADFEIAEVQLRRIFSKEENWEV